MIQKGGLCRLDFYLRCFKTRARWHSFIFSWQSSQMLGLHLRDINNPATMRSKVNFEWHQKFGFYLSIQSSVHPSRKIKRPFQSGDTSRWQQKFNFGGFGNQSLHFLHIWRAFTSFHHMNEVGTITCCLIWKRLRRWWLISGGRRSGVGISTWAWLLPTN